ncbi:AAA family ATPase [Agrobacterium tumefaciens]|uniref:AAA family ATPase n=1 Tax=Agrobacterium tumefaciens TaxID=358 RepID=UPI0021D21ACC|nr:AAA family ATPase [Agrobacterium tumefaciens]UXS53041.1 AAA family ATPase [Agrobacterium tumefaciens]UXS63285.1 AAA family ATPase [Agrobacterium tumefaciens]
MRSLQDVNRLSITDFRSISGTINVPLDAPIILIHGPNGTGKTSVLSALELALTGNVRTMKEDDANFARHVVHEGAQRAKVVLEGSQASADDRGNFVIEAGRIAGTPYLDGSDGQFFSERCYLAQSMLGRLLDIYQKSKATDGESALTQFVKDLLGLSQLDALIDGLHDAGDKRRTRNLIPEYRAFEDRIARADEEITLLNTELATQDKSRAEQAGKVQTALNALLPNETLDGLALESLANRLGNAGTEAVAVEATRRLNDLRSLTSAWAKLPTDSGAEERAQVEADEQSAREAANEWRTTTGAELEKLIASLRVHFPDLPSWSSTDPTTAAEEAERRIASELSRIETLLNNDEAAMKRESELKDSTAKEEARGQLIDSQISELAQNTGQFASALAALLPHIHTDDCPVCGRDFSQVSPDEPLSLRVQKNIAKLTDDASRLTALASEKTASTGRLAQLRRELSAETAKRISDELRLSSMNARAGVTEGRVALLRLWQLAISGTALLINEAELKGRLASFRERDRGASELLSTAIRMSQEMARSDLAQEPFDNIVSVLIAQAEDDVDRATSLQAHRASALQSALEIVSIDERRKKIAENLKRTQETRAVLAGAITELEKLKEHAKIIADTAQEARTKIVRRVFNESLNTLWRDLFVRLAPTEPFVPAFKIGSDSKDFAQLETVHRNGRKGGTPGSMLSAGNLNTAALTLFLALHFSVGARIPWLVLDDPVQNMDEVHVAQFAALLRTISRAHGTKVVIAVHERTLFDYLKLELSPSFEKDRLLAVELRRAAGEPTTVDPDLLTYHVDAVAA